MAGSRCAPLYQNAFFTNRQHPIAECNVFWKICRLYHGLHDVDPPNSLGGSSVKQSLFTFETTSMYGLSSFKTSGSWSSNPSHTTSFGSKTNQRKEREPKQLSFHYGWGSDRTPAWRFAGRSPSRCRRYVEKININTSGWPSETKPCKYMSYTRCSPYMYSLNWNDVGEATSKILVKHKSCSNDA